MSAGGDRGGGTSRTGATRAASLFDFGPVAGVYDQFYASPRGRDIDQVEKRLVGRHLARLDRGPVVELGCGTGHWTAWLSARGYRVIGLDLSPQMLSVARARMLPDVHWARADLHRLPLADASVRRLVAVTVLEFVAELEVVAAEMERVLAPGAWLLVGCLNADSVVGRNKQGNPVYRDARFFTAPELRKLLERFGPPRIEGCVLLSGDGQRVEDLEERRVEREGAARLLREGAFLVGSVRVDRPGGGSGDSCTGSGMI